MKFEPKIAVSIAVLTTISFFNVGPAFADEGDSDPVQPLASSLSVEDELEDYQEAKERLLKALELYKNANASNVQERYKNALAAYVVALKEMLATKAEILKDFNSTIKEANSELQKIKSSKPKPTAIKLAAATKAKNDKVAEAVAARDAALSSLGSLGDEPTKPVVKNPIPTPKPSPTKKKK